MSKKRKLFIVGTILLFMILSFLTVLFTIQTIILSEEIHRPAVDGKDPLTAYVSGKIMGIIQLTSFLSTIIVGRYIYKKMTRR